MPMAEFRSETETSEFFDHRNFWERLGTHPRDGEVPDPLCEHGCGRFAVTYWTSAPDRSRHPVCEWHWDIRDRRIAATIATAEGGGHVRAEVSAVHTRECGAWHMPGSKRYRPCSCGAQETWERLVSGVEDFESFWELAARLASKP